MRRFVFFMLTCLLLPACVFGQGAAVNDLQFPYEALVLREDTPIRSGPGKVHYATDELSAGTMLEVYRHDPGGWCAIRPPEGSFSLIPESAIEIVDDGIGRVKTGTAQAWVGTRLGVVENPLWQVRLREDERVEILGEVSWPNPEGHSTIWYQISPPSGEFRWVQQSDLQLPDKSTDLEPVAQMDEPTDAVEPSVIGSAQTEIVRTEQERPKIDLATAQPRQPESDTIRDQQVEPAVLQRESRANSMADTPIASSSINSGWRRASRKINRSSPTRSQASTHAPNQFTAPAIPSLNSSSAESYEQQTGGTRVASANLDYDTGIQRAPRTAEATRLPSSRLQSNFEFDQNPIISNSPQLSEIEMRLTSEMLKQPAEWRLDDLLLQTEAAIESSVDPVVTQHGNRLLAKIRRCQNLRSQFRTAYNDNLNANTGPNRPLKGAIGTGVDQEVEFGTTYDAFGWLRELKRRNNSTGQSTYVLQDDNGKITHHISASPGFNLHRYLESKVGIIGQRGYHQALNLDHVTAQRVIELQQRR